MYRKLVPGLIAALFFSASSARAENDTWDENDWNDSELWNDPPDSPWEIKSFLEGGYGRRLQNDPAISGDTTLGELRARLEADYVNDNWQLNAKGDLVHDDVIEKTDWQTRELAIAFTPAEFLDIKAGRQILTWGTGDFIFLNDLFPKDWQAFFSGRDDEYLKAPSDSVKASLFYDQLNMDVVWTPKFTADQTLTGERFSFFSPAAGTNIAPSARLPTDKPSGSTWSARLSTAHKSIEYALYGYIGYWTVPSGVNAQGEMTYPRLNSWGASLRSPAGRGLFNTEFAWYDSRENRSGNLQGMPNSQFRWLAGYEQEVVTNLTAAIQYYLEWTLNYDELKANTAFPEYLPEQYRQLLTLRLTWLTFQQKLTWSLFTFWSPSDQDTYLKPSVTYRVDDHWSLAAGANLFHGKNVHTFFGQHENNSNAWMRIRYRF